MLFFRIYFSYNVEVVGSSPIKGSRCLLEQETLPLLLRTGWFQERIRAWYHNRTKINRGPYGRLTQMSNKPPSLNIVKTKKQQHMNASSLTTLYYSSSAFFMNIITIGVKNIPVR